MSPYCFAPFALAGFLLPQSAAVAPAATPTQAPNTRTIVGAAAGICRDGEQLLAFGADYKALFAADGFEFVPALGRLAERNLSVHFRLATIARGDAIVLAGRECAPVVAGNAVTYDRGDVTERAQASARGLELSYRFARRPAGIGDLIVRLAIATELTPAPVAHGLLFARNGLGGVEVGGVTGIDARGETCGGSVRCASGCLELRLPAGFVDRADYPLVLDPLIGTSFLVSNGTDTDTEPVAAYDGGTDRWLVVWRRIFSATDSDVLGQRLTGAGTPIGAAIVVRAAGGISYKATVVNCNVANHWFVAWQESTSPLGPFAIRAKTVDPSTGTIGPTVVLDGALGSATEPDAWGDNSASATGAIVVWRRGTGAIAGCTVTIDSAGVVTPGPDTTLATAGTNLRSPTLSVSAPGDDRAVMAWLNAGNVRAIAIDRTLALLGSTLVVDSNSNDYDSVDIDGDGTEFVCAFAVNETATGRRDVRMRPVRWNGSTLVAQSATLDLAAAAGIDEVQPSVGWTGPKAVVLWTQENTSSAFNLDVQGAELSSMCQTCGTTFTLTGVAGGDPTELLPSVATEYAEVHGSDDALIVYAEVDDTPSFPSNVITVRHEGVTGGTSVLLPGGCGGGGTMGSAGSFGPGNTQFEFTLNPVPGFAFIALGVPGGELPCGTCTFVNPIVLEFVSVPTSFATYTFPLPCNYVAFLGFTLSAQWIVFQATSISPCPLVPGLTASPRLECTIAY